MFYVCIKHHMAFRNCVQVFMHLFIKEKKNSFNGDGWQIGHYEAIEIFSGMNWELTDNITNSLTGILSQEFDISGIRVILKIFKLDSCGRGRQRDISLKSGKKSLSKWHKKFSCGPRSATNEDSTLEVEIPVQEDCHAKVKPHFGKE